MLNVNSQLVFNYHNKMLLFIEGPVRTVSLVNIKSQLI